MKTLLFTLLFSSQLFASWQQVPQSIVDWNQEIGIDQEKLIDLIYSETAWNYFVGDDGEECDGIIGEIILSQFEKNVSFTLDYSAQLEESYACISYMPLICDAQFKISETPSKYFPYNWEYKIECDYEF